MGWFSDVWDDVKDIGRELDPTRGLKNIGRQFDDHVLQEVRSAGRSIDEEIFQPITDNADDWYKENLRPWMSEIGSAAGMYFLGPQGASLGGRLGGLFEEGGLDGLGGGAGGLGGASSPWGGGKWLDEQIKGFDEARDLALANQTFARDSFSPYMSAGKQVMTPILAELGIGGTPYKDPLLDQVINQQLRDVQQSRKAQGLWGAGSTPGALADATLQTQLAMRDNRMRDLMNVAGLGAQSTGSLISNEALMTDSLMKNAIGRSDALSDAAWQEQIHNLARQRQLGQDIAKVGGGVLDSLFGDFGSGGGGLVDQFGGWIGDIFGFNDTTAADVDLGGNYGGLFDIGDFGSNLGFA